VTDDELRNVIDRSQVRISTSGGFYPGANVLPTAPVKASEAKAAAEAALGARTTIREALGALECGDAATAMLVLRRAGP